MDVVVQSFTGAPPPHTTGWVAELLGSVPVPSGALVTRGMTMTAAGMTGYLIGLWPDGADPDAGAAATDVAGSLALEPGRRYQVVRTPMLSAASAAAYMQITAFDGPRHAAWRTAFLRAGDGRIAPVLRDTPGILAGLVCAGADGGMLTLTLAESVESLEAALRAVMSTELLPGEDPAHLTGPDRVDVHRLVYVDLPEAAAVPA